MCYTNYMLYGYKTKKSTVMICSESLYIYLVNNLLHDTQLQSVANYLQQVTYNFSLRRQKTSLISRERETLSKLIEIKKKSRQGLLTTNLLIIHLQVHKQTYHTENTE